MQECFYFKNYIKLKLCNRVERYNDSDLCKCLDNKLYANRTAILYCKTLDCFVSRILFIWRLLSDKLFINILCSSFSRIN